MSTIYRDYGWNPREDDCYVFFLNQRKKNPSALKAQIIFMRIVGDFWTSDLKSTDSEVELDSSSKAYYITTMPCLRHRSFRRFLAYLVPSSGEVHVFLLNMAVNNILVLMIYL
jgi:hypothetical protein